MNRWRWTVIAALICCVPAGCAKYQYTILEPTTLTQSVPRKGEVEINRGAVAYDFEDLGDSLGVKIENRSNDPILLVGERSYVVDPDGATNALRSSTIAPRSYIAFTLPPAYVAYRPDWDSGWGFGARSYGFVGSGFGSTWVEYPLGYYGGYRTFTPWEWDGGEVRLHLTFDRAGEPIEHEFLIRRVRVD